MWIEERRLEHRILEARGIEALAFEAIETEVGDEVRPPGVEGRPCFLVDEEALLTMKQKDGSAALTGILAGHIGSVIVPSWSVRSTVLGKPRARRPDASDATSCAGPAARSRPGDRRLRPPPGRSK